MMKCKQAIENPTDCGKVCCCFECEDIENCKDACSLKSSEGCPDSFLEENQVTVFEEKTLSIIEGIKNIATQKKALEEQDKVLRESLESAMEKYGVKSFENDVIKVTYVAPTTKTTLDSKKLKEKHPDIYAEYSKISDVKACVKISVK